MFVMLRVIAKKWILRSIHNIYIQILHLVGKISEKAVCRSVFFYIDILLRQSINKTFAVCNFKS